MTHRFTILLANKPKLADAAAKAMNTGESVDFLNLTLTEKLYDTLALSDFPTVTDVVQHVQDQGGRGLLAGDIILSSEQKAWVYAGLGDLNEVTTRVGTLVDYPEMVKDSNDADNSDAGDAGDEDQGAQCPGCGGYHDRPRAFNTLSVGKISDPRNVERDEMQSLIQTAIGAMFTVQNIPLTRDHARRAVRSMVRIGVRMLLEQGGGLSDAMALMFEAIDKESKALGKTVKARTVAVYSFEENKTPPVPAAAPDTQKN
jgi:hypothetical protein